MDIRRLGTEIASARKGLRLTQAEVAARANVARQTVSNIENARNPEVGFASLSRVLHVLGLELSVGPASGLPSRADIAEHRRRVLETSLGRSQR